MEMKKKQKNSIFENHIVENLKKYYNIDDHTDLFKYIKKGTILKDLQINYLRSKYYAFIILSYFSSILQDILGLNYQ